MDTIKLFYLDMKKPMDCLVSDYSENAIYIQMPNELTSFVRGGPIVGIYKHFKDKIFGGVIEYFQREEHLLKITPRSNTQNMQTNNDKYPVSLNAYIRKRVETRRNYGFVSDVSYRALIIRTNILFDKGDIIDLDIVYGHKLLYAQGKVTWLNLNEDMNEYRVEFIFADNVIMRQIRDFIDDIINTQNSIAKAL